MERCKTCEHWLQNTFYTYEGCVNLGTCKELRCSDKISIELRTGWDGGYVHEIITEDNFGCTEHKERTNG